MVATMGQDSYSQQIPYEHRLSKKKKIQGLMLQAATFLTKPCIFRRCLTDNVKQMYKTPYCTIVFLTFVVQATCRLKENFHSN